jgi:aryl-alcohol dehydrogenase-like predicted oxidoreductase
MVDHGSSGRVPHRRVGTSGPSVSVLSLGSWHTWDRMEFEEAVELVRFATDIGINLYDVGYYNVGPHVERSHTDVLLGRILPAAGLDRSDYQLCTKLWLWEYPAQRLATQLDRALFRVGAEHTELVILGDFVGTMDMPRLVTEMGELVRAGRVGHWGFNNWSAADVLVAHEFATAEGLPTPQLAQLKYNLCRRSVPEGAPYREIFTELGVSLQASDVFEGGLLAGNAQPERRIGMDTGGIRERILDSLPELTSVAAELGATPAQLAIAFCLTHPATATVLFGASKLAQLKDNLGALDLLARHGDTLRERVGRFWLDQDVVAPTASWGTD